MPATKRNPKDPRRALAKLVSDAVQFSSDDVVRHQLLFQRTIPGFEPSPDSFALALEFYAQASAIAAAAGVRGRAQMDMFTALVSGLAHQQVANDPGGRRWVRLADQVVDMFLAGIDKHPSSSVTKQANPRRERT